MKLIKTVHGLVLHMQIHRHAAARTIHHHQPTQNDIKGGDIKFGNHMCRSIRFWVMNNWVKSLQNPNRKTKGKFSNLYGHSEIQGENWSRFQRPAYIMYIGTL